MSICCTSVCARWGMTDMFCLSYRHITRHTYSSWVFSAMLQVLCCKLCPVCVNSSSCFVCNRDTDSVNGATHRPIRSSPGSPRAPRRMSPHANLDSMRSGGPLLWRETPVLLQTGQSGFPTCFSAQSGVVCNSSAFHERASTAKGRKLISGKCLCKNICGILLQHQMLHGI